MSDAHPPTSLLPPPPHTSANDPNGGNHLLNPELGSDGSLGSEALVESPSPSETQTPVERTKKQILAGNIHYAALCFSMFMLGWNDGSTGPLLPRMQEAYVVSYIVVSLFFVLSCLGFVLGALMNVWLTDRLEFGKAVHLLACFILVYVGVEVTIGGWIVTFIIQERGGGPSSGYIASGFFGGLTLGRVILLPVNKWIGKRRALYIYAVLSFGLEFLIWFLPSLIGNAITVSFIGLALGPMYPMALNQAARILPPWILTGAVGWIAGFGQAGSALVPFVTGAVAQNHGIKSLHPLLVAMMALMIFLFALTPNKPLVGTTKEDEEQSTNAQ